MPGTEKGCQGPIRGSILAQPTSSHARVHGGVANPRVDSKPSGAPAPLQVVHRVTAALGRETMTRPEELMGMLLRMDKMEVP